MLCAAIAMLAGCAGPTLPPLEADEQANLGTVGMIVFSNVAGPLSESDDLSTLTLEDAASLALRNDPRLPPALGRMRPALAEAEQARLLPNPVLDVAVRFPEGGGLPVIDAALTGDILALLLRPRRIGAADHRLRAAGSQVLVCALDVFTEVRQIYLAVQSLEAQLIVLNDRRQLVQRLVDLARSRVEAGESGQLDVITLQTDLASLGVEISEKSAELRQQRLALARLIGEPAGAAEWHLKAWSEHHVVMEDEAAWIAAALDRRPEIQAQRWQLAALCDDLAVARVAIFDGLNAGADSERDPEWTVGPAVSTPLPLFDWGEARRSCSRTTR